MSESEYINCTHCNKLIHKKDSVDFHCCEFKNGKMQNAVIKFCKECFPVDKMFNKKGKK